VPFCEKLFDQRAATAQATAESAKLGYGVLRPLDDQPMAVEVEVEVVTGTQAERRPDLGGDDQPTLPTKSDRGTHVDSVPRRFGMWHWPNHDPIH
jgi:hypothetical protein